MVSKDGQASKYAYKIRNKKPPIITIKMNFPTSPSGTAVEAMFDLTTISNKYLFDLHRDILK